MALQGRDHSGHSVADFAADVAARRVRHRIHPYAFAGNLSPAEQNDKVTFAGDEISLYFPGKRFWAYLLPFSYKLFYIPDRI
jgi:hypothetical protein